MLSIRSHERRPPPPRSEMWDACFALTELHWLAPVATAGMPGSYRRNWLLGTSRTSTRRSCYGSHTRAFNAVAPHYCSTLRDNDHVVGVGPIVSASLFRQLSVNAQSCHGPVENSEIITVDRQVPLTDEVEVASARHKPENALWPKRGDDTGGPRRPDRISQY